MKKIVIVEDEAAIRENYIDVLKKHGYNVQGYDNRPDAQAAFEQNLPDLAIIDIGLQNEIDGGFSLCQSLRALSPTVPIIFLTARDSDFDTVCGLRMGADDYLTKDTSLPPLDGSHRSTFSSQRSSCHPRPSRKPSLSADRSQSIRTKCRSSGTKNWWN